MGMQECDDAKRRHQRFAERQYQRALLERCGSAAPEDVEHVLIACIVFIAYEDVRGDYQASSSIRIPVMRLRLSILANR